MKQYIKRFFKVLSIFIISFFILMFMSTVGLKKLCKQSFQLFDFNKAIRHNFSYPIVGTDQYLYVVSISKEFDSEEKALEYQNAINNFIKKYQELKILDERF